MTEADGGTWVTVLNHEEQYSVWPADREPPLGWTVAGPAGTRQDCLDHIATVWTDLRPASLRARMTAGPIGKEA